MLMQSSAVVYPEAPHGVEHLLFRRRQDANMQAARAELRRHMIMLFEMNETKARTRDILASSRPFVTGAAYYRSARASSQSASFFPSRSKALAVLGTPFLAPEPRKLKWKHAGGLFAANPIRPGWFANADMNCRVEIRSEKKRARRITGLKRGRRKTRGRAATSNGRRPGSG